MKEKIDYLRKFFQVSMLAFRFQRDLVKVFGDSMPLPSRMEDLHSFALEELNKENPDLKIVDGLLAKMEQLAKENKDNG